MKEVIRKSFLLGLGAVSLTRKKANAAIKGMAKKAQLNKKEAEALVKSIAAQANKERKRLQGIIQKEAKTTATRWGYISKQEANRLKARIKKLESRIKRSYMP